MPAVPAPPRPPPLSRASVPYDPRMPQLTAPPGEPVYLSSQVLVAPNSLANLDSQALTSPRNVPMYVDELVFIANPTNDAAAMAGGAIGLMLKLGSVQITNNYVPIWCLDRRYDSRLEVLTKSSGGSGGATAATYRWRFDEPLFVPPGAALNGSLQQFGVGQSPATVVVGVYGREMPPKHQPAKLAIPFATAFVSKQIDGDAAATENSPPTALANSTGKTVKVSRITGRLLVSSTDVGFDAGAPTFNDSSLVDIGGSLFQIQMWHSTGHPIVRTLTPFHTVFPPSVCAITVPHDLAPRGFYTVRIDKAATATVYDTTDELGPGCQAQIAIIGSRGA